MAALVAALVALGMFVAGELVAAVAVLFADQVAGPAGAVAMVDWELSVVEGRWSAVVAGRKAVAVDWTAACCFPDAVGGPVGVEE